MRKLLLALFLTNCLLAKDVYVTVGKMPITKIKKGQTFELSIPFRVQNGFHIQANPASNASLISTEVLLGHHNGIQPGTAKYPPGKPYRMQGADNEILVYSEKVEIKVPLTVLNNAKAGKMILEGNIRYQACNDRTCMFPQTDPIRVAVHIK